MGLGKPTTGVVTFHRQLIISYSFSKISKKFQLLISSFPIKTRKKNFYLKSDMNINRIKPGLFHILYLIIKSPNLSILVL